MGAYLFREEANMDEERIKAAANGIADEVHTRDFKDMAHAALTAADVVMFNNEAVDRAAEAIYMTGSAGIDAHWDDIGRQRQEWFRGRARTVIAALKCDDA